jgi:RimJ/RimL family protein N-acetyltransferase
VNKNNVNSIKVYEKLGFKKTGPVIQDIGNGFVMDDYKMEKDIT